MNEDLSLYGITEAFDDFETTLISNDGELTDNFEKIEAELTIMLQNKVDGCCGYVQRLKDMIENAKAQKERLNGFIKEKENKLERFAQYVQFCIDRSDKDSFVGTLYEIKIRKAAKKLVIIDENLVPSDYIESIQVIKIDKMSLKKAVQSGAVDIQGINLVDGKRSVTFNLRKESRKEKSNESE